MVLPALLAALLWLSAAPVGAADKDSKDGRDQQLRGLQQRLRVAEQDKSRLALEKAELDGQVKASADQLNLTRRGVETANRQRSVLARELEATAAAQQVLAEQLVSAQARLAELESRLADAGAGLTRSAGQLQRSEMSARQLGETLALRDRSLAECSSKNDDLYRVGGLLLGQFEIKGEGSPLENEPLTRLARVAVENKVEEYRDQLDQQRYGPQALARQTALQRQVALQQADEALAVRDRALLAQTERERHQRSKAKQQSELDKLTVKVRSFFENMEW